MKEVIYKIVSTLMYKNRQILPIMIEIRIAATSERRPHLEGGTEDFSGVMELFISIVMFIWAYSFIRTDKIIH